MASIIRMISRPGVGVCSSTLDAVFSLLNEELGFGGIWLMIAGKG
jgi:hypothetical protein